MYTTVPIQVLMNQGDAGTNFHKDMFNRWTPTHTDTNIPALGYQVTDQNIANGNYVDFFLTKASYFSYVTLHWVIHCRKILCKRLVLKNCAYT